MNRTRIYIILMLWLNALISFAQFPTFSPYAVVIENITEKEQTLMPGGSMEQFSAPLHVRLFAGIENADGYETTCRWQIVQSSQGTFSHEADADGNREEEFSVSGRYAITLYAVFKSLETGEVYEYGDDTEPIIFTVKNSRLEMPNAFSPNGDGINDYYGAKSYGDIKGEKYCERGESIIEFHATIFSRWGQKIYSWDDVNGSWDGKMNGKDVKPGVYYVNVRAKGADGTDYNIKKDVNLLRGFKLKESTE